MGLQNACLKFGDFFGFCGVLIFLNRRGGLFTIGGRELHISLYAYI